jgi:hypothetical protein
MEEQNTPNNPTFERLIASTTQDRTPAWAVKSRTTLAHGSGTLPVAKGNIGWQPLAGPGSVQHRRPMTPSMRSLRQRIVRGEA